jgi:hypothetical protein
MMDYYEELGIERTAPVADIRLAYRRLMQLLHPDRCVDENGRRLAELQARRLNAMLAVLTNPVERECYDRELSLARAGLPVAFQPSAPGPGRLGEAPGWLWPAAGGAIVLALISLWTASPRGIPKVRPPVPPAAAQSAPKHAAAPGPESVPRARPSRSALAEPTEYAALPASGIPIPVPRLPLENPPTLPTTGWQPEAVAIAPLEAGTLPPPPTRSAFAGEWLFLPQGSNLRKGLYPPEYIELRVTERAGLVSGRYKARYRVTDRAISPNVTFEFEGRAGESDARLPWTGPSGAHGEVTLHLLTTGALEVTWVVSQLGGELGLISGTATLVRKMD